MPQLPPDVTTNNTIDQGDQVLMMDVSAFDAAASSFGVSNSTMCAIIVMVTARYYMRDMVKVARKLGFNIIYGDIDSILVRVEWRQSTAARIRPISSRKGATYAEWFQSSTGRNLSDANKEAYILSGIVRTIMMAIQEGWKQQKRQAGLRICPFDMRSEVEISIIVVLCWWTDTDWGDTWNANTTGDMIYNDEMCMIEQLPTDAYYDGGVIVAVDSVISENGSSASDAREVQECFDQVVQSEVNVFGGSTVSVKLSLKAMWLGWTVFKDNTPYLDKFFPTHDVKPGQVASPIALLIPFCRFSVEPKNQLGHGDDEARPCPLPTKGDNTMLTNSHGRPMEMTWLPGNMAHHESKGSKVVILEVDAAVTFNGNCGVELRDGDVEGGGWWAEPKNPPLGVWKWSEGPFASAINSNKNLEIRDKLANWYGLTFTVGSTLLTSQMPHLEDPSGGLNANLNPFNGIINFKMGTRNEDARTTLTHEDEPDYNAELPSARGNVLRQQGIDLLSAVQHVEKATRNLPEMRHSITPSDTKKSWNVPLKIMMLPNGLMMALTCFNRLVSASQFKILSLVFCASSLEVLTFKSTTMYERFLGSRFLSSWNFRIPTQTMDDLPARGPLALCAVAAYLPHLDRCAHDVVQDSGYVLVADRSQDVAPDHLRGIGLITTPFIVDLPAFAYETWITGSMVLNNPDLETMSSVGNFIPQCLVLADAHVALVRQVLLVL
ncbi:hypothetical protein CABS01_11735 [Colletotrichum abscissum]|uniref:Uncharacterized protein n=1 Tax=Colletotrichum abscissum TaxID=1671311 RepID=A0A9Q0B1P1_9PEZI|nr:uncharacterized protein CABS01_11735 [Colletotrichum abscissum]KAI3548682.1 hypothetical protein CABS02_08212 [Colletotrichum abscissum]KAK1492838.1 hypothetical protein CABS01_11735 [Colletotrichum abscissum]